MWNSVKYLHLLLFPIEKSYPPKISNKFKNKCKVEKDESEVSFPWADLGLKAVNNTIEYYPVK